ncbi:MAG: hypothetical protein WCA38_11625 [Candidatus Acidiferrales bacterium]
MNSVYLGSDGTIRVTGRPDIVYIQLVVHVVALKAYKTAGPGPRPGLPNSDELMTQAIR